MEAVGSMKLYHLFYWIISCCSKIPWEKQIREKAVILASSYKGIKSIMATGRENMATWTLQERLNRLGSENLRPCSRFHTSSKALPFKGSTNLHKQNQQPKAKCSKIWVNRGQLTFKPPQLVMSLRCDFKIINILKLDFGGIWTLKAIKPAAWSIIPDKYVACRIHINGSFPLRRLLIIHFHDCPFHTICSQWKYLNWISTWSFLAVWGYRHHSFFSTLKMAP